MQVTIKEDENEDESEDESDDEDDDDEDDDDDDDDDEVRRVCKIPGDPCGCTRQHFQRSGLPLPSPGIWE